MDIARLIRPVPDFPKPGILFRDITPLLADPHAFRQSIKEFADHYRGEQIDAIAPQGDGLESVVAFGIISGIAGAFALLVYPLAGALSDRTTSRAGRRKPWILGGALVWGTRILGTLAFGREASAGRDGIVQIAHQSQLAGNRRRLRWARSHDGATRLS